MHSNISLKTLQEQSRLFMQQYVLLSLVLAVMVRVCIRVDCNTCAARGVVKLSFLFLIRTVVKAPRRST